MTSSPSERIPSVTAPPPWEIPSTTNAHRWQDTSWVDMERLRVETEISALFFQIATLRNYLNTLSAIAKLPPEILAEIFLIVIRDRIVNKKRPCAWVVASVCRQWRSIALQTASLWAVLDLTRLKSEWMNLLFERSQSVPLSLTASNPHKVTPGALHTAFRNIHRFSSFKTPFVTDEKLEPQTLPLLKLLSLGYPPRLGEPDIHSTMPSVFDQCEFPNLRNLSLRDFPLNPASSVFASTLKELTIERTSSFTIPMLAQILSRTPSLESFSFSGHDKEVGSDVHLSPVPPNQRISLPCLKSLHLSLPSAPMRLVSLLNHFSLPPRVSIFLDINLQPPSESHPFYRGLRPTIVGNTRTGPPSRYRTCVIDLSGMFLGLWYDTYPTREEPTVDPSRMSDASSKEPGFVAKATWRGRSLRALVFNYLDFVKQCPLEDVESLLINDASGLRWDRDAKVHPIDWHSICSLMPNVSKIHIHTYDSMAHSYYLGLFSKVLLLPPAEGPNAENPLTTPAGASSLMTLPPVLPHLTTLVFSRMAHHTAWVDALLETLAKRKSRGAASIGTIVLDDCSGFPKEDEERLWGHVQHLVVLGRSDG